MASSTGRLPEISKVKFFISCTRLCRCCRVREWAGRSSGIWVRRKITGIMERGSKSVSALPMERFLYCSKSRSTLASSLPSSNAGFKSMARQ